MFLCFWRWLASSGGQKFGVSPVRSKTLQKSSQTELCNPNFGPFKISIFCAPAPPRIKHFSTIFHFSAVFGPNGPSEATSTEKISTEPAVFVASPAPPVP